MLFLLYLFFTGFCLISTQTNLSCPNCKDGCDESLSCWNSTCNICLNPTCIQYYGNNCNKMAPQALNNISITFTNNLTSNGFCNAFISTPPFNTTPKFTDINPLIYYLISGTDTSFNNNDLTLNFSTQMQMTLNNNTKYYETLISFNQLSYFRFAIYFTFEDMNVYGYFNSSISTSFKQLLSPSNCSVVITTSTTTASTTTASTTTARTTTTIIPTATVTPSNFTVQNMLSQPNFTFIQVKWNPPKSTINFSSYALYLNSESKANFTDNSINNYTFFNLLEGTPYNVTVTSFFGSNFYSVSQSTTTFRSIPPSNLSWEKSYTYGIVYWNMTPNFAPDGFKIYLNNIFQSQYGSNTRSSTVTSLNEAKQYTIRVSAFYYGGQEVGSEISVWTRPYKFDSTTILPLITAVSANSFIVNFPSFPNYKGDINVYYILVQKTQISSRKKRDVISCQANIPGVPSSATIRFTNSSYNNNNPAIIGYGTSYPPFNCPNDKLLSQTNYTVYTVVGSLVNGTTEYTISSTTVVTLTETLSPGAIAGIIIAIILFIILLILLIYFLLKCRKNGNDFVGIKGPYEDVKPKSSIYWSNIIDKMQSRKIILDKKNVLDGLTFKDEFDNLPPHPCYEHNTLELSALHHSHECSGDNIRTYEFESSNDQRSLIDGYLRKSYISLQTPSDQKSITDFWRIVYDENIAQIVMITMEGEIVRPSIYSDTSNIYGEIEVSLIDEKLYACLVISKFKIRKVDSKKYLEINHYHYFNWPTDDNLQNVASFLEFHEMIRKFEDSLCGSIIVYSQSGCSLNALYIGFDILYDQMHKEMEVNVFREIGKLRRYRPNMMITIGQYMMIYDLLFESHINSHCLLNFSLNQTFEEHSIKLNKTLTDLLQFLKEFYFLSRPNKIHHEKYDIFNGVKCSKSIILKKSPNPFIEESIEFWNIVFSKNTEIIVDLVNHHVSDMSYISQNFPNYEILKQNTKKYNNNIICVKIQMKKYDTNDIRYFKIFAVKSSMTLDCNVGNCLIWIELIYNIIKEPKTNLFVLNIENSSFGSIFVVCLNAATKLIDTNFVSLYYVIKSLQSSGQQIINDIGELNFIYKFLETLHNEKMQDIKMNSDLFFNLYPDFNIDNDPFSEFSFKNQNKNNVYESQT